MGLLGALSGMNIDAGIRQYQETSGAVLLDVRTPEEFKNGHIPKSVNLPLDKIIATVERIYPKDQSIFLYCHSGSRSASAAFALKKMGYVSVRNIGGIVSYKGRVER